MHTADVYMKRCFELAQRAKGNTAPNPMVGAVLVHNNRVIGEGWHHFYGADHAEVNCLKNVKQEDQHLIKEATMYVSLEPCAHQGLTPPCAVRLVNEQVKEVVIANIDPFEKVSGNGIDILQTAGIKVTSGIQDKEGKWVNRRFFCYHQQKRPYIILKWAQTASGFIAPANNQRLQLTNQHNRQLLHKWRTEEGAFMVGTKTAIADDPQLTARYWKGKQPLRIVVDRKLRLPASLKLFDEEAATWVVNEERETLDGNIHYIKLEFDDTLLNQLLQRLYDARILSVVIEGGSTLLTGFISAGLWDEARVFYTNTNITDGLAAPILKNALFQDAWPLGSDLLKLYLNENSAYPYVPGQQL